jgi:hypothetical protein
MPVNPLTGVVKGFVKRGKQDGWLIAVHNKLLKQAFYHCSGKHL